MLYSTTLEEHIKNSHFSGSQFRHFRNKTIRIRLDQVETQFWALKAMSEYPLISFCVFYWCYISSFAQIQRCVHFILIIVFRKLCDVNRYKICWYLVCINGISYILGKCVMCCGCAKNWYGISLQVISLFRTIFFV